MAHAIEYLKQDQAAKKLRASALFINYDADHRRNTRQDRKVINTHVAKRAQRKQNNEKPLLTKASDTLQSYLWGLQIGGLRTEPFDMLPVGCKGFVPEAFDYYTQVYAPAAVQTGNMLPLQARTVMSNLLENSIYFESMIAMMLMMRNLPLERSTRMSSAILYHTNSVIIRLRGRLSASAEMYSDTVIMVICALAIIQRLAGEYSSFDSHIEGLRRIVSARGGLENLGWHGTVSIAVKGTFESWKAVQRQHHRHLSQSQRHFGPPKKPIGLHVLSPIPDIELPSGFQHLNSIHELGAPTLDYLSLLFSWHGRFTRYPNSIAELSHEILNVSFLNTTERVIAITVQAYLNYLERTEQAWCNAATERSVSTWASALSQEDCIAECGEDVLVWSCLMLAAVTDEKSDVRQWADRMLVLLHVSGARQQQLGESFLPIP